jgi:phage terminase large subunit-like protein
MSSLIDARPALRVGTQRPNRLFVPSEVASTDAGDDAVEFAESIGYDLLDWQAWFVRLLLSERADGSLAAPQSVLIVPRQNGKNVVLEVVELYSLYVQRLPTQVHTAHEADTAAKHMAALKSRIKDDDDLDAITRIYESNGKERIVNLETGGTIWFRTRTKGTKRGSSPQRVVFDEALYAKDVHLAAMVPAMAAQSMDPEKLPQLIFTSSAPVEESEVLHRLRRLSLEGRAPRTLYAEWGADLDVDPTDRDTWYETNPSLGLLISEDFVNDTEFAVMAPADFATERLGVPKDFDTTGGSPIDPDRWAQLTDADSLPNDETLRLALDAPPDRKSATFATAGKRPDNLLHVQIREHLRPTQPGDAALKDRVVDMALKLSQGHNTSLILPPSSPARAWKADLLAAGVSLDEMTPAEYAEACGRITNAIDDGALRHRGQPEMNNAVAGLAVRSSGDVDAWSRRNSSANIAPFVAATCALVRVPDTAPSRGLFLAVT